MASATNNAPTPSRQKLVILGTSLFAPEVCDLAEDTGEFEVTAFIENWERGKAGQMLLDRPIIWIDDAAALASTHLAVCSLGTTRRRMFIEQVQAQGFKFATIIHPRARISTRTSVAEGSIVSAGAVIAAFTTVGRHTIINRGALIGHHTRIGDYVTICPGANIAGAVTIETQVYVGIGAVVVDRVAIGESAVIAAGAVVTRDVPDRVQILGVPGRIAKRDVEGR